MLEILAIGYFTKKIRTIADEKNIKPSKWIWRLVLTWFGVEIGTIILIFALTNTDIDNGIFIAVLPALILAALSAFFTVEQLKKEPKIPSDIIKTDVIEA
ncbi:hypothetical protein [Maribacter sp. Asnod1-A12]|uniref:hypothetical protein n=1 Tax=Maribacter sp. Asnod1-A12 TaxID=3160576 RepID=UPI00386705C1